MSYSSDIAFTEIVKEIQSRKGSRKAYARMEQGGSWQEEITPDLETYIASMRSIFVATANAKGQPYIQHRGGPPGFLKVLDRKTIAFADFQGNKQFITQGNLQENPQAFLFLIDFLRRSRVKIWGTAEMVENDAALLEALMPAREDYSARPEQVFRFTVKAWDINCPQHIPQRIDRDDVLGLLAEKDRKIAELERLVAELQTRVPAE